ncbi:MAG TPA: putative LPS assembly protein LptD [Chitinophagales bacterium]|nr:putative LPS assembly protein LptD [Chitinophagales bacterium]
MISFLTVMLIASCLYASAYTVVSSRTQKSSLLNNFQKAGSIDAEAISYKVERSFLMNDLLRLPFGHSEGTFLQDEAFCNDFVKHSLSSSFAIIPPDTIPRDTTKLDSLSSSRIKKSSDSLDAPVKYHADDSTWMDVTHQKVYLIGNAKVEYKDITLTADSIVFDWSNSEVIAIGRKDSSGKVAGKPMFAQGDRNYKAERIAYSFKTKKGKITEITTQEGEGFIRSDVVKRLPNEVLFGKNNIYTTCDEDHPHFYIATNKIKVIPNKAIITGPANLVVADVRTPLFVPFGIFPLSDKRKSGIIFPEYGERTDLGFYLEHGGYYFGISDHLDLALSGNIYSKGSWLLNASSRFISRYRFSGGFSITYSNTRTFFAETNKYVPATNFKVNMNYAQDAKARPNSSFNATVSFATPGFAQLFGNPQNAYLDNTYQSSISYRQTIPNSPFNYTISASHSQSTLTHVVSLQLPVFNFSMNQLYPFQKKEPVGKPKWFEKIGLTYTLNARNQLSTLDTLLFHEDPFTKTFTGVLQQVPISAPFQIFRYLIVTPSFNYNETWALQTIRKSWDATSQRVINDTIRNFAAARDYSLNMSASTRLYGMVQFKHGKIKAIRHVFNPSVGYSYRPDFSESRWNAFKTVQVDSKKTTRKYSIFEGGIFSGPPAGKFSGINVSLNNNLEMKVFSKKDTVTGMKKIKLLDAFAMTGSYNFAVDTLRMSVISMSGRTTLFDKININFGASFDPYIGDTFGRRQNVFVWDAQHKLARLTSATIGLDARFESPKKTDVSKLTQAQTDYLINSQNVYEDFSIPWSFSTGYSLFITKVRGITGNDSTAFTQTINFNGSFNLTRNWRITGQTSFDFVHHEFPTAFIQINRDLHCWELSMSWIPFGIRQSYTFTLRVKASVLQDLKLHKQQGWNEY